MTKHDPMEGERVSRETLPTIAFTARLSQKRWIEQEAKARNVSKSEVIRDAIDLAKSQQEELVAA
jgi:hypothetical protein